MSRIRQAVQSMIVMKANVRRPAELVFMGATGKNNNHVVLPRDAIERNKYMVRTRQ